MPHKIDILLGCKHINHEAIEAAVFRPQEGEDRTCQICHKSTKIIRVGTPYWVDDDDETKKPG